MDPKLPSANLIRALSDDGPGRVELRTNGDGAPVLAGHFAVFNEWTEIDSYYEGRFLERIAPGAFKKTFSEQADRIRCILEHGMDDRAGNRPLGAPRSVAEDDIGAAYEVPLFAEADYVRELLPALRAGQYGSSFRFQVMREELVQDPGTSDYNPHGWPERTLTEMRVSEFGPCVFPAYESATAGVRSVSLTDRLHPELRAAKDPAPGELERMLALGVAFLEDEARADDFEAMAGALEPLIALLPAESRDAASAEALAAIARARNKETQDGAGATPHPSRGARDKSLYLGASRKENAPSWRL